MRELRNERMRELRNERMRWPGAMWKLYFERLWVGGCGYICISILPALAGFILIKILTMKKIIQFSFVVLAVIAVATSAAAQKKIKEGVVKFEMSTEGNDSPEMAMMGGTTLDFYFTGKMQRMDMNMMGGLMRIQTIVPTDNPKDAAILMDMMGQKFQIIELSEEDINSSNSFMNMDNVESVTYDEKDKKDIAGYSCYRANVKMNNGTEMKYYITEKIQPPMGVKNKDQAMLKGYPLEMIIDTGQDFEMIFVAKEILKEVPKDTFKIPEGYTKKTMEEFEKEMGDMNLSPGGN